MKRTSWLIALLAAAGGFAAAWLLKAPPVTTPASKPKAATGAPAYQATRPLVLTPRSNPSARPGGEANSDPSGEADRRDHLDSTFRRLNDRIGRAKVLRVAEALGLSEAQRGTLEGALGARRQRISAAAATGDPAGEIAAAEEDFARQLEGMLDAEQREALQGYRERMIWNDAATSAHRDIVEVTREIDLSPEQHSAVFEALRKEAFALARSTPRSVLGDRLEGLLQGGFVVAEPGLEAIYNDPETRKDPAVLQQRLAEARRRLAEARTELLKPILTPQQLTHFIAVQEARIQLLQGATVPPPP